MVVVPGGRKEFGPIVEKCLSHPLLKGRIGGVHQRLGGEGEVRGDQVGVDHGHLRKPTGERKCSIGHRIDR